MNINDLIAIDVHTHAEVSCRQEPDEAWKPFEEASAKYFKAGKRPNIHETIAYYRERKIGLVMFTVDTEFEMGVRRIPNQEVIDAARENSDMMVAFASIDPHKGKMGVREARRLIEEGGIRGFKFHPTSTCSCAIAACSISMPDARSPGIFRTSQGAFGAKTMFLRSRRVRSRRPSLPIASS